MIMTTTESWVNAWVDKELAIMIAEIERIENYYYKHIRRHVRVRPDSKFRCKLKVNPYQFNDQDEFKRQLEYRFARPNKVNIEIDKEYEGPWWVYVKPNIPEKTTVEKMIEELDALTVKNADWRKWYQSRVH